MATAGTFYLTANFTTWHYNQDLMVSVNGAATVEVPVFYSVGWWNRSQPIKATLLKGNNSMTFSRAVTSAAFQPSRTGIHQAYATPSPSRAVRHVLLRDQACHSLIDGLAIRYCGRFASFRHERARAGSQGVPPLPEGASDPQAARTLHPSAASVSDAPNATSCPGSVLSCIALQLAPFY